MERTKRINYRGLIATPDTAEIMRQLEARVAVVGWGLEILKSDPVRPDMAKAGREVQFRLRREGATSQEALEAAWSFGVPLGLTPWSRWPVESGGPSDNAFHVLGPWQLVADNLLSEGRGHLAWPSVERAALADAGLLEKLEYFVQAQLHRLGKNPGPVDGVIGPRTQALLEGLALKRNTLSEIALYLKDKESDKISSAKKPVIGHINIPNHKVFVQGSGGVRVQRQPQGAILSIAGPGRVVVDVGE